MAALYAQETIPYHPERVLGAVEWLLEHPDCGGIWIVEADGSDAGYLVITVACSLEFGGRFALLDELYIVPEWRGRGLGPDAVAFAATWAGEHGMSAVRLEVSEENEHAVHVYRKAGFEDQGRRILTKRLDATPTAAPPSDPPL